MTKRRSHRRAQRLGVEHVGGAAQRYGAAGAEGMGRPDQGADVAGILHAVQDEQHPPRLRGQLRDRPVARLDDRQDALRGVGCRERSERARGGLLDRHTVAHELGPQRRAARRAVQVRRDQGTAEGELRGQGFLDEADAFDERQPPATPRFAALEIADGGLQITGYGSLPRTGRL